MYWVLGISMARVWWRGVYKSGSQQRKGERANGGYRMAGRVVLGASLQSPLPWLSFVPQRLFDRSSRKTVYYCGPVAVA
jgi:hypothetical protein